MSRTRRIRKGTRKTRKLQFQSPVSGQWSLPPVASRAPVPSVPPVPPRRPWVALAAGGLFGVATVLYAATRPSAPDPAPAPRTARASASLAPRRPGGPTSSFSGSIAAPVASPPDGEVAALRGPVVAVGRDGSLVRDALRGPVLIVGDGRPLEVAPEWSGRGLPARREGELVCYALVKR